MNRDENGFPIPRKEYVIITGLHGESAYRYQVFATSEVKAGYPELWDRLLAADAIDTVDELTASLSPMRSFERGPGRAFGSYPSIRIGKRNIIIRQFTALDI